MSSDSVEIRCPLGPQKLFLILRTEGSSIPVSDNLMELACSDCKRSLRRKGLDVRQVLHSYDLAGVLVKTKVL